MPELTQQFLFTGSSICCESFLSNSCLKGSLFLRKLKVWRFTALKGDIIAGKLASHWAYIQGEMAGNEMRSYTSISLKFLRSLNLCMLIASWYLFGFNFKKYIANGMVFYICLISSILKRVKLSCSARSFKFVHAQGYSRNNIYYVYS